MDNERRDRVKSALSDPIKLCEKLGLMAKARKNNGGVFVLCPWHEDRNPSCSVHRAKDGTIAVRCWSCGQTSDIFGLVEKVRGLSGFSDSLAACEAMIGIQAPERKGGSVLNFKSVSSDSFDSIARALLKLCPLDSDGASYLSRRGILEEARRAMWGCLPAWNDQERIVSRMVSEFGAETLVDAGLLWKSDEGKIETRRFVRADNRLLIPYFSSGEGSMVLTIQRRLLRGERDGTNDQKYVFPRGRTAPEPFGVEEAMAHMGKDTVVVYCEGATDSLALRRAYAEASEDRVVLGIPGVKSWNKSWSRYAVGHLALLAFDADAAGQGIVRSVCGDLMAAGAKKVASVKPKGAKDWCAMFEGAKRAAAE